MAEFSLDAAVGQVLAVLREAFEGAERWSYFTDHGANAGLLGTLAKLGATDASRSVGGSSIAAHTHHVVFSLEASAAWIRGDHSQRPWPDSWKVKTVDNADWTRLREELRSGYDNLCGAIQEHAASGVEAFGGAVGAVAHMAYHLAAIRQKIASLRQP